MYFIRNLAKFSHIFNLLWPQTLNPKNLSWRTTIITAKSKPDTTKFKHSLRSLVIRSKSDLFFSARVKTTCVCHNTDRFTWRIAGRTSLAESLRSAWCMSRSWTTRDITSSGPFICLRFSAVFVILLFEGCKKSLQLFRNCRGKESSS